MPPPGRLGSVPQADDVLTGLSRSYLFEDLTRAELEPLAAEVTTRRLVRGEYVFHQGDPADEIYVVQSGEVKDSVVDADGYEMIYFVHGPGMTFGEPGYFAVERTRIVEVIAVQPSTLIRLGRPDGPGGRVRLSIRGAASGRRPSGNSPIVVIEGE
jgi:signal-transduction protein with cAMP-binding, CBS, and nucleotidyltransferase domain